MILSAVAGDPCNSGSPWECCRCEKCCVLQERVKDGSVLPRPRLLIVPWARGCSWCTWSRAGSLQCGQSTRCRASLCQVIAKILSALHCPGWVAEGISCALGYREVPCPAARGTVTFQPCARAGAAGAALPGAAVCTGGAEEKAFAFVSLSVSG